MALISPFKALNTLVDSINALVATMRTMEPAQRLRAVAPNNSVDLPDGICACIWVGGAGDVNVMAEEDTVAVIIPAVAAGTRLDIRAKRILVTGTTATNISAWYN